MTKNGLNAFMHCLADEVGGSGVRVNSICPGWVETRMAQDAHRGLAADLGLDYETHYANNMRANMLGALVTTDSVADVAVFLASERGRHITAQELTVCGGCLPGASAQRRRRKRPSRRDGQSGGGRSVRHKEDRAVRPGRARKRVGKQAERAPAVEGKEKLLLVDVAHAHVLDLEELIEAVVRALAGRCRIPSCPRRAPLRWR